MADVSKLMLLRGNARFADLGLLLLRVATGAFLIYQSHDNVFSAAMVHSKDPVPGIWPAAILVFLGLYFGPRGSGRYGLEAVLDRSDRSRA